jgi:hypothetical protein
MAAEYNEVAIPALGQLVELVKPLPIILAWGIWGLVRIEAIPQHLAVDHVMDALPVFPGNNQPRSYGRQRQEY